jgi:glycosyltransferase involved in cell wall biosynthesis
MQQLSIVLPCLDEVSNMARVINSIRVSGWTPELCEIIVVDDGSTDGTRELLIRLLETDSGLNVTFTDNRLGLAKSVHLGLSLSKSPWVAVMDTDGMHDPAYLSKMFKIATEGKSLVIASRYAPGGVSRGAIYPRLSQVINRSIQIVVRSKVRDQLCGYFLAETEKVMNVPSSRFTGFGEYFIGLVHFFETEQLTIAEIGTVHRIRDAGIRKSRRFQMLRTYFKYALEIRE